MLRIQQTIVAMASVCTCATAAPLLTITCEAPSGVSIQHGVSSFDQFAAMQASQPLPTKQVFGHPVDDGYERAPTFVIQDSKRITVLWRESVRELKLKEFRRTRSLNDLAATPSAEEAKILLNMSPVSISAFWDDGFQSRLYSFYPKDGFVFISEHYKDVGSKASWTKALYAKCEFVGPLLR